MVLKTIGVGRASRKNVVIPIVITGSNAYPGQDWLIDGVSQIQDACGSVLFGLIR